MEGETESIEWRLTKFQDCSFCCLQSLMKFLFLKQYNYQVFDVNGDGFISKAELKEVGSSEVSNLSVLFLGVSLCGEWYCLPLGDDNLNL